MPFNVLHRRKLRSLTIRLLHSYGQCDVDTNKQGGYTMYAFRVEDA